MQHSRYQSDIFDWIERGHGDAVVEAMAGSGKTTTIVDGANRITSGKPLFVAFNVSIVKELKARLGDGVDCKTINSLGHGALMKQLGKNLRLDVHKYSDLIKDATVRLPDATASEVRDNLGQLVSFAQTALLKMPSNDDLNALIERYTIELNHGQSLEWYFDKCREVLDKGGDMALQTRTIAFNDQIWLPNLWSLNPWQYQFIFVDEAQDLSTGKLELVMRARAKGGRMLFVGDSRQSIYGFAGADPSAWQNIIARTNATILPLSICYRCPTSHLDLARQIVPQIEARPDAPQGIIEHIAVDQLADTVQTNDLILCRTTAPLVRECLRLIKNRIPARVMGRDIGKQMVTLAKSVQKARFPLDKFDVGIEKVTADKIAEIAKRKNADQLTSNLLDRKDGLIACYEGIKPTSYERFYKSIVDLFADSESVVTMATVHRVKGLQRKRVLILNPELLAKFGKQDWQKEQEANLKYVALTRSQDTLIFVHDEETPPAVQVVSE